MQKIKNGSRFLDRKDAILLLSGVSRNYLLTTAHQRGAPKQVRLFWCIGAEMMEHRDHWRVRCDMTGETLKYDVFRGTQWDKRKRRFMDIEFAPGQPVEGFDDEMDAWRLAWTLNKE